MQRTARGLKLFSLFHLIQCKAIHKHNTSRVVHSKGSYHCLLLIPVSLFVFVLPKWRYMSAKLQQWHLWMPLFRGFYWRTLRDRYFVLVKIWYFKLIDIHAKYGGKFINGRGCIQPFISTACAIFCCAYKGSLSMTLIVNRETFQKLSHYLSNNIYIWTIFKQ